MTAFLRLAPLAGLLLGGCSVEAPPSRDPRTANLAKLEAMGRRCGYPRSGWNLTGTDELRLKPPFDARYEVVDCMLAEIKKSGLPFKLGFVGNEAYIGNEN